MAKRETSDNKLVKCEYCGEMYSVTYKHCPFCNEDGTGRWDDLENLPEEEREEMETMKGGKRASGGSGPFRGSGRRGPSVGRIIAAVVSLALIIAAICIVVSIVRSILGGDKPPAETIPTPPPVETVIPSGTPEVTLAPSESQAPVIPDNTPAPGTTPVPTVGNPTGFSLNREDFTLGYQGEVFQMKAIFTPADSSKEVVWKSSDPNIASVAYNGTVAAVAPGTVTITATVEGLGTKECIVRCNFPAGSGTTVPDGSSAGLALNREDFTLGHQGETFRLTVTGTNSPVVWAIGNSAVATIAGDGTVTAVGNGMTTVTATVDGHALKCIVRCKW